VLTELDEQHLVRAIQIRSHRPRIVCPFDSVYMAGDMIPGAKLFKRLGGS